MLLPFRFPILTAVSTIQRFPFALIDKPALCNLQSQNQFQKFIFLIHRKPTPNFPWLPSLQEALHYIPSHTGISQSSLLPVNTSTKP